MIDKKQITTSKNAKTILFASLIATMILPFSTMDFAMAQEATNEKKVKVKVKTIATKILEVQEKIANVKENLENTTNETKIAKLEAKLAKLEDRLVKLEQKLTEIAYEFSQSSSTTIDPPAETETQMAKSFSLAESSTCYGLINEVNDCTSDMDVNGDTVTLIQPVDNYTVATCPSGSQATICADFVYSAYDILGWYQNGNDFYFYKAGYTNTCTTSNDCSTWAVIARGIDGNSLDISMNDAPTGIPMKTTWYMYYEGALWGSIKAHSEIQNLADGYDPTP